MAVAIDNTDTYNGGYTNPHTLSAFQCNGANSHLIVGGYNRNLTTEISGVTANGNAMTLEASEETGNVGCGAYGYTISNASFDIVGTAPLSKPFTMSAIALSGVDQSTPVVGTPVTTSGFGTTATASYTGTSGNLLLVFVGTQGTRTLTASGVTQIHNINMATGDMRQAFSGYVVANGSSQTIGATVSSGDNYAITIIEIKASGGAPPAPTFIQSVVIV